MTLSRKQNMSQSNMEESSEIPADLWDQAIAEIDSECGYTVEFAPDPHAHRAAYRERAELIADDVGEGL